ncbi:MAG: hypothetical protein Q8L68_03635 [Methylococcales bacterium]|nr:hypothetical protein [Methylococcales bacterium]
MINWHRLFGLFLMDFFTGSPYVVELEKDLSFKQQFLDVVILRKEQDGTVDELPDGFDNLTGQSKGVRHVKKYTYPHEFYFLLYCLSTFLN